MAEFGYHLCKNNSADRLRVCSELGLSEQQLPVTKKTQNWLDLAAVERFALGTGPGRAAYAKSWARANIRLDYVFEAATVADEFDDSSDDEGKLTFAP